jgi:hypothetical protein
MRLARTHQQVLFVVPEMAGDEGAVAQPAINPIRIPFREECVDMVYLRSGWNL